MWEGGLERGRQGGREGGRAGGRKGEREIERRGGRGRGREEGRKGDVPVFDEPGGCVMRQEAHDLSGAMAHTYPEGVEDDAAVGAHEEADETVAVVGGGHGLRAGGREGGREGGRVGREQTQ